MNDLSLIARTPAVVTPVFSADALDGSRRALPGHTLDLADPDHV